MCSPCTSRPPERSGTGKARVKRDDAVTATVARAYASVLRAMSLCGGAAGMGELLGAADALRDALELLRED
jgi:hypothetical protein